MQPTHRVQPARRRAEENAGAVGQELGQRRHGNPEIRGVGRTGKWVGGDADDRERLRPQAHGAPDEFGVPAELRRPGTVGHDGHGRGGVRVVVGWSQQAAVRRRRPQHREESAGYKRDVHPGRGASANEREIELPEGRERERLRARGAQLQVLGMAQRGETAVVELEL